MTKGSNKDLQRSFADGAGIAFKHGTYPKHWFPGPDGKRKFPKPPVKTT